MKSRILPLILGLAAPLPAFAGEDGYFCGFFTICTAADDCTATDTTATLTPNDNGFSLADKAGDLTAQMQVFARDDGNLFLASLADPARAVYLSVMKDGTTFVTEHSYRGRAVLRTYYGQCEVAG